MESVFGGELQTKKFQSCGVYILSCEVYILQADYRGKCSKLQSLFIKCFKVAESIFYRRITEEEGLKLQSLYIKCFKVAECIF